MPGFLRCSETRVYCFLCHTYGDNLQLLCSDHVLHRLSAVTEGLGRLVDSMSCIQQYTVH